MVTKNETEYSFQLLCCIGFLAFFGLLSKHYLGQMHDRWIRVVVYDCHGRKIGGQSQAYQGQQGSPNPFTPLLISFFPVKRYIGIFWPLCLSSCLTLPSSFRKTQQVLDVEATKNGFTSKFDNPFHQEALLRFLFQPHISDGVSFGCATDWIYVWKEAMFSKGQSRQTYCQTAKQELQFFEE